MNQKDSPKDVRRKKWFELGANAVALFWPDLPRCYVCPLCGKGYLPAALQLGALTLEHAPPRGMGGREVALTCRSCNNRAGHTLDAEMIARESQLDFLLDTMDRPLPGFYEVGGERVNANIQRGPGGIHIAPREANNNPDVYHRVTRRVADMQQDETFKLELARGFRQQPAIYGLLRAAYLVAFAALGYLYSFSPQLRTVRQQLANTDTATLKVFSSTVPSATKDARLILLVEEPSWLHSLAIQFGRHLVFLPPFEGGESLYEDLAAENEQGHEFHSTMSGKIIEWPRAPQHALDFI